MYKFGGLSPMYVGRSNSPSTYLLINPLIINVRGGGGFNDSIYLESSTFFPRISFVMSLIMVGYKYLWLNPF